MKLRDARYGLLEIRLSGEFSFRISDPADFYKKTTGTDGHVTLDEFVGSMRTRVVAATKKALRSLNLSYDDLDDSDGVVGPRDGCGRSHDG